LPRDVHVWPFFPSTVPSTRTFSPAVLDDDRLFWLPRHEPIWNALAADARRRMLITSPPTSEPHAANVVDHVVGPLVPQVVVVAVLTQELSTYTVFPRDAHLTRNNAANATENSRMKIPF
jgi:hypothetical protein